MQFKSFATACVVIATLGIFACGSDPGSAGSYPFPDDFKGERGDGHLTLALKFVQFKDAKGKPVLSPERVRKLVAGINHLFEPCNLHMRVERYEAVDPADYGLRYGLSSLSQMDEVREPFDDRSYLVVTNTGAWSHGSMGAANAWTAMPGESPAGVVTEASVADFAGIIAHELGHYLNLDHFGSESNLMNPVIYAASRHLTSGQCSEARETAQGARKGALRS